MSQNMNRTPNRFLQPRLLIGLLVAPLVPGILFLLISVLGNPTEGFWALKLSALVGYPTMIILGLPAHIVLGKCRWTNLWGYGFAGLLIGVIVSAILFSSVVAQNFSFIPDPSKSLTPVIAVFFLAAFLGALSSVVFWLIARPDRQ
jgi:hypothetical protein